MPYERTIEIALADGALVRFNQSGLPIERYSVVLVVLVDGIWQTARVYDNHLSTHHMHRYTRGSGKQDPEAFHAGATREAIPAAIAHLKTHWEAIIQSWRT
ncbi:MAG TPA: hypothetical protein VES97_12485 [Solirubrobacteraceae bacterium]|nr:hypothetical protein [Solirubrobacteraceae bacterium]